MSKKLCLLLIIISIFQLPQMSAAINSYYTEAEIENFNNLRGLYSALNVVAPDCEAVTRMTKEELVKYGVAYFHGGFLENYVEMAETSGYIESEEKKELSETATGADLVKIMVKGLGYDITIQNKNDADEYIRVAVQVGILKGIKVAKESQITYLFL